MPLNRDQILAAVNARATELTTVDVPEWGGEVLLRRMTAGEAEASGLASDKGTPEKLAHVIALSVVDDKGQLLFSEDDVAALAKIDVGVAAKVFTKAIEINGLSDEALDAEVAAFVEAQRDSSSSS